MKTIALSLVLCLVVVASHVADAATISIAPYLGNRQAAVSYTFDDGLQDQYTLARPVLNRLGLRATFAIIGSKIGGKMRSSQDRKMGIDGTPCMIWEMITQLSAEGHEIGSHGWEHKNVTKLSGEALRHEVEANDSAIIQHIGSKPMTYFYPGNAKSDETTDFCEKGRVGSRTFQTSIGSKRTEEWLRQWVEELIRKGEWGIGMTHGIATGYDHFPDPQVFFNHLEWVASKQDSLWIAPLAEVCAYVKERDAVQLKVKESRRKITITPSLPLDKKLFHQPLTLILDDVDVKEARQGNRSLKIYHHQGKTLIDVLPNGGKIVIRR